MSYADANQVKPIHAHQIAPNTNTYWKTVWPMSPTNSPWWSSLLTWATATTNTRSKNSSSGVADPMLLLRATARSSV